MVVVRPARASRVTASSAEAMAKRANAKKTSSERHDCNMVKNPLDLEVSGYNSKGEDWSCSGRCEAVDCELGIARSQRPMPELGRQASCRPRKEARLARGLGSGLFQPL
jgi:hypothetical protein